MWGAAVILVAVDCGAPGVRQWIVVPQGCGAAPRGEGGHQEPAAGALPGTDEWQEPAAGALPGTE